MDGSKDTSQSSRFTSQGATAEDLLKTQTVGLVKLSDYKKRRAEALEQKEREASEGSFGLYTPGTGSGSATPNDGALTPQPQTKKKKKNPAKGKLSFAFDNEGEDSAPVSKSSTPRSQTPNTGPESPAPDEDGIIKKRLGPNASVSVAPKIMTKAALLKEAQTREQLRKEFVIMQEAVKATEFLIPFVFFDGSNIDGGVCKVKKGDHIWLFLDRSRKIGADRGVISTGEKVTNTRREWARVSVDDLMLVRGELIIPHHYEFYYFIVNKTLGLGSKPLFAYSSQPTENTPSVGVSPAPTPDPTNFDPLSRPSAKKDDSKSNFTAADSNLEGADEDPTFTKIVDRRWYERNKHIYPASLWEEFDPTKDYSKSQRRDAQGNLFFF